ncbi:MAG: hybrid sensor histidine kinase/response regulator, partial [Spirochaetes bacterium]
FDRADENVVLPVVPGDFFAGRRVLVVDDNDVIRDRISRTLSAWGFNVDEAGSAEEALFLIRSSDNKKYELVIVDQTMPHIDGWQFASEVHSDSGIVPPRMILMSMKGGVGAVEAKMKLLGWFDSYLTKPIRQSDLSASVFRLLSSDMDLEEAEDLEEIESVGEDETLTSTAGFRILIAEDHEVNRKLLQTILEKNGHQVLEAPNGKVAYEVVAREKPDLVFMDCQMPVMNGYESTERIRKGGYEAPVIAVTASALAEEREKCLNCGMSDLVTKPFKQTDILMMIERYLGIGKRLIPKVENKPVETGMAVFDYAAAVDTFLGNEELVRSLLRPQMEKMEGEVKMIRDAVSGKDWETVRTTAHSIKGSCRNMDMNRCGEAAAVLESAGKNTDEQGAVAALPRLEAEFPLLKAEVEKILSS